MAGMAGVWQQQEATGSDPCNSFTEWLGCQQSGLQQQPHPHAAAFISRAASIQQLHFMTARKASPTKSRQHSNHPEVTTIRAYAHCPPSYVEDAPSIPSPAVPTALASPYAFSSMLPWPLPWPRTCSSTSIASATLPSPKPSTLSPTPAPAPPAPPAAALTVLAPPPPSVVSCSSLRPTARP